MQSHCSHLRVICLLPCFCLYGGFVIVSYCDFNFIFIVDEVECTLIIRWPFGFIFCLASAQFPS